MEIHPTALGWVLILGLYLLPTFTVVLRGHHQRQAILVLNVFLDWTLLGWIGALVWAHTAVASPKDSYQRPRVRAARAGEALARLIRRSR